MKPSDKIYAWFLMLGGALGLLASFVITDEKLKLLQNPNYVPSCSINPVISCGSVMKTAQASAIGFPNSWIGLGAFAVVIVVGAGILAGGRFAAWYWRLFNFGTLFGVLFVHWLFIQSVFYIHALCPWCMVVWSVTIPIFWYTILRNLREGHIPTPSRLRPAVQFVQSYKNVILVLWYLAIAGTILAKFWYYFKTVL
jgi:uncharacterized membrane protein